MITKFKFNIVLAAILGASIVSQTATAGLVGSSAGLVGSSALGNPAALSSVAITGSQTITALSTPAAPTGTPLTTGGTIPASTTNYATIVALDSTGTVAGLQSAAVVTTGTTSSIVWAGTPVTGAVSYQFWFSTTSGTYTNYFASASASFTQTLPASGGTAGTFPTGNSTGILRVGKLNTGLVIRPLLNDIYAGIFSTSVIPDNSNYALRIANNITSLNALNGLSLQISGNDMLVMTSTGVTLTTNMAITGNMSVSGQVTSNAKNVLSVNDMQIGQPCVAITVGASPFAYTATYGGDVTVGGGVVSAMTKTRASVVVWNTTLSNDDVPVRAGDILTVSYTTVPVMYQCSN